MENKKEKHIPLRMCVGCREMIEKSKLIRLVVIDDALIIDKGQKVQSRGIYVCRKCECIENANKKKVFSRILKSRVSDELLEELIENAEG